MKKKNYINLKHRKSSKKKKDIKVFFLIIIFLISVMMFLVCYVIKEKKILLKEKLKLEKEREIFEKNIMNKEYYFYRYLCPKEVIGKKKFFMKNMEMEDMFFLMIYQT